MCGILATLTNLTPAIQLWDSSGVWSGFMRNMSALKQVGLICWTSQD